LHRRAERFTAQPQDRVIQQGEARPGYYYAQPQWVRQGDRWGYHAGGWTRGGPPQQVHGHPAGRRDRDRDGTPDRWDRDRDGDGVPNRHDMRPNNPYRY